MKILVAILVIPTNEELKIARETRKWWLRSCEDVSELLS